MPPKKPPPGNPLWISWLEEWQTTLEDKGAEHPAKAVKNAIKSFKSNPVPIDHPFGATTLKYVGDKTIQYLVQRMKIYCEENGLPMPIPQVASWEHTAAKTTKKRKTRDVMSDNLSQILGENESDNADVDGLASSSSPKRINTSPPKRPRKSKPYIPRHKSGAFAILIGLASYGSDAWVSEEQIVERGDPFYKEARDSLTDVDKSKGGSGNYGFSGWTSMNKMIIAKGYATKRGQKPVLYCITRQGWKIACKAIRNAKTNEAFSALARRALPDLDSEVSSDSEAHDSEMVNDGAKRKNTSTDLLGSTMRATQNTDLRKNITSVPVPLNSPNAQFHFSYLDANSQRVMRRDQADLQIDPTDFTSLYFIEFRECQKNHPFTKRAIKDLVPLFNGRRGPEGKTLSAFLPVKYAPELCSGLAVAPLSPLDMSIGQASPIIRSSAQTGYQDQSPSPSHKRRSTSDEEMFHLPPESTVNIERQHLGKIPKTSISKDHISGAGRSEVDTFNQLYDGLGGEGVAQQIQVVVQDVLNMNLVTLRPETYSIRLVLDSREKPGLNTKKLENLMTDKGVPWEARTLAMGDAIWIAQHKQTGLEVVLDCCLERKRIDDLLSSLKDGRYAEQKDRMKKSGISRLMYLVEETGKKIVPEVYGASIETVKSQLQIIDGFNVHIVPNVAEVGGYLVSLTKALIDLHKHACLHILPETVVRRETYLELITELRQKRPATSFYTTFTSYQEINAKRHSISSNWAKMIASINLMSLERTFRFVDRFPTPSAFFEGLDDVRAKEFAEMADSKQAFIKGQGTSGECWIMRQTLTEDEEKTAVRPIGQKLSTHCWNLFTAGAYELQRDS